MLPDVEFIQLQDFPGALAGRKFDYVIAMDLLDRTTSSELLEKVYELLAPGGEIVFYESNPWNPVHKLRGLLLKLFGKRDPRNLVDRPGLYELLSEIGFIRIYAVFNDFVFAPAHSPADLAVTEHLDPAGKRALAANDGRLDFAPRPKTATHLGAAAHLAFRPRVVARCDLSSHSVS